MNPNFYIVIMESTRAFHPGEGIMTFDTDDSNALKTLKEFIEDNYDVEVSSVDFTKSEREFDPEYIGSFLVKFITDEFDFIISGIEVTDIYHVYNMGTPEIGRIYPSDEL